MFVILLKFSDNKANAGAFMDGHNAWIKAGFDDEVFLLVGSIKPGMGGAIIAHNVALEDLETRVKEDPFVQEGGVTAEFIEIDPARTDERLAFLKQ
ncbi:MAG: YciI family protein [Hyphomicrobiales bacterium]